jgi:hypothetical protein
MSPLNLDHFEQWMQLEKKQAEMRDLLGPQDLLEASVYQALLSVDESAAEKI